MTIWIVKKAEWIAEKVLPLPFLQKAAVDVESISVKKQHLWALRKKKGLPDTGFVFLKKQDMKNYCEESLCSKKTLTFSWKFESPFSIPCNILNVPFLWRQDLSLRLCSPCRKICNNTHTLNVVAVPIYDMKIGEFYCN